MRGGETYLMIAMSGACVWRRKSNERDGSDQLDKTRKLDRKKGNADSSELEHGETVS